MLASTAKTRHAIVRNGVSTQSMPLTEGHSGAQELSAWTLKTVDAFSVPSGGWAPLAVIGAASLLLVAWTALDRSPLGAPAAALASSFVLVLLWAQLIRSEHEEDWRQEADTVLALGRLLGSMRPEWTGRDAFSAAVREVLQLTGARGLIAALEHRGTGRLLVIQVSAAAPGVVIQVRRAPRAQRALYYGDVPGTSSEFGVAHHCRRSAVFPFTVRDYWAGRLFLLDPPDQSAANRPGFGMLVQQCVSALSATRDVPRIRRRAAAHERARLGRELHDGVVQELVTLDVDLELLRRAPADAGGLEARLADVQARLREQVRDLRHLEERARAYEVDPSRLRPFLADVIDRFGRDTGIEATYEASAGTIELPPRVCGEIVRIVQEALVNVRRHSGADRVAVRFACEQADWQLSIEDDGRGLRTWGTASPIAGAPTIRPPAVIEERVRSVGGTLRLVAGAGARLEIGGGQQGPWVSRRFESW